MIGYKYDKKKNYETVNFNYSREEEVKILTESCGLPKIKYENKRGEDQTSNTYDVTEITLSHTQSESITNLNNSFESIKILLDFEMRDEKLLIFQEYSFLNKYIENQSILSNIKLEDFNLFHRYLNSSSDPLFEENLNFPNFLQISISSFKKLSLNEWLNDEVRIFGNFYFFR